MKIRKLKQKKYRANWILCLTVGSILSACVSKQERVSEQLDQESGTMEQDNSARIEQKTNGVTTEEAQLILEKALKDFERSQTRSGDLEGGQLKKLSIPKVGASESPRNDGIHDNFNNAIATLQDPTRAMADFPRDRRHQVDWVAALEMGLIKPRADIEGKTNMMTMDMDIIMKNTQYMPWVKFPHKQHTEWLACENCHPAIFLPQEHANAISMNKVLRGKFCGVCHDKVAFAIFICERCHSVPHEGSGKKWW